MFAWTPPLMPLTSLYSPTSIGLVWKLLTRYLGRVFVWTSLAAGSLATPGRRRGFFDRLWLYLPCSSELVWKLLNSTETSSSGPFNLLGNLSVVIFLCIWLQFLCLLKTLGSQVMRCKCSLELIESFWLAQLPLHVPGNFSKISTVMCSPSYIHISILMIVSAFWASCGMVETTAVAKLGLIWKPSLPVVQVQLKHLSSMLASWLQNLCFVVVLLATLGGKVCGCLLSAQRHETLG